MISQRIRAFDWLRGLAVLVMIQTHSLVLLKPELRAGDFFARLQWIDGLVAPSFIFAAGFAMALTQVRAAAGGGSRSRRFKRTLRRLGEVLVVATLVNWAWFPIFREPRWLIRIDILHCIGFSLLIALPILALLAPHPRALRWASLALAVLAFGLSPLTEGVPAPLGHWPSPEKLVRVWQVASLKLQTRLPEMPPAARGSASPPRLRRVSCARVSLRDFLSMPG